ncbi:MAG: NAD-dependent dehydratase [Gammaproteobacteria bacterium]|nr:NAD-dependent dehydratase [Gammaproteobacteria bacterium]
MSQAFIVNFARHCLVFLWFFTAVVSVFGAPEIDYRVLAKANIVGIWADLAVYGGAGLDLMIAIWLVSTFKKHYCYIFQVIIILAYSILLSFIDASFWLHPFGPLSKNLPIVALLFLLLVLDKPKDNKKGIKCCE